MVTHGPPYGVRDGHIGNEELLVHVVDRIRPRFHIFGHYHGGHGVTEGRTTFINAALCRDTWGGPVMDKSAVVFEIK
jgi:Icc-related predicted phosphoesterase